MLIFSAMKIYVNNTNDTINKLSLLWRLEIVDGVQSRLGIHRGSRRTYTITNSSYKVQSIQIQ